MKNECDDSIIPLFYIDNIPEMKLIGYMDIPKDFENQLESE